ncbi:MAG: AmmeMemoRadiSam system protein A [Pseudomonadota bacterium]
MPEMFSEPEKLSKKDGQLLLTLARQSILHELGNKDARIDQLKLNASKTVLEENRGTFVTLHKKGELRGCIGNIHPEKTIFNGVADNARHAAFKDPRFRPMSYKEFEHTQIEVSILTCPEKLEYKNEQDLISKLVPEVHGVIIEKGYHKATFLPQVWHQLKTTDDFLSHLCSKAGLSSDDWKSCQLDIYTYQVQLFEEPG